MSRPSGPPLAFPVRSLGPLLLALAAPFASAQKAALLGDHVRIYYDESMVPHVVGDTDEAAFYGLGYHHMMEYPIGTLNMLWRFSGRMAEVAGESYLDEDRLLRLWEFPALAEQHAQELQDRDLLRFVDAYVQGVEAGRAWWRGDHGVERSDRLDGLLDAMLAVEIDPVPDWANPIFSPYGAYDDPQLPGHMRKVLNRFFQCEQRVTRHHVLALGLAVNSFFLYRSNPVSVDVLASQSQQQSALAPVDSPVIAGTGGGAVHSNGWMVSPALSSSGNTQVFIDPHVPVNELAIRPYIAQVWGDTYRATGLTMPGYPAVYEGYNPFLSWVMTGPSRPVVARNRWQVTLNDDNQLGFEFTHGANTDTVLLERVEETLRYFDPVTCELEDYLDVRHYVPVHPAEPPTLGFRRYPVLPDEGNPPAPGAVIEFQQASFTTQGCPWTFCYGMGRARDADADVTAVLDEALMIFGDGVNLMVADRDGNMRYHLMSRPPAQGAAVPPALYDEQAILDGADLGWRWTAYLGIDDLPQIGPENLADSPEVWINNNATPDKVETSRFEEADLTAFPAYVVPQHTLTTWRQRRAEELLRPLSAIDLDFQQTVVGVDVRDTWMVLMWPFFQQAPTLWPGPLTPDMLDFLAWVEAYRQYDATDAFDPGSNFDAHVFSRVTVYTTLLRSYYEDHLAFLAGGGGLTPLQQSFGVDPEHPLFTNPGGFGVGGYAPNIEAMITALTRTAALWRQGSGPQGLHNQETLHDLSALLVHDPWSDPRYDSDQDPLWDPLMGGTKVTRWGHVNLRVGTPHYLLPPKRAAIEATGGSGGDPIAILQAYLFSALYPPNLLGLPFAELQEPFYQHAARVLPLPGTTDSLFVVKHKAVIDHAEAPKGYQELLYRFDADGAKFYYHPHSTGSNTLFNVELLPPLDPGGPGRPAFAFVLQAFGGTEVTVADLLDDGRFAYQQRFAPSQDFADGRWTRVFTQEDALGHPRYRLRYVPLPLVKLHGIDPGPPPPPAPAPGG